MLPIPNSHFFQSPIMPFFYTIPALVYSHYEIEKLRGEVDARMAEIEKPKAQRFVHNGFRKTYRDHFK